MSEGQYFNPNNVFQKSRLSEPQKPKQAETPTVKSDTEPLNSNPSITLPRTPSRRKKRSISPHTSRSGSGATRFRIASTSKRQADPDVGATQKSPSKLMREHALGRSPSKPQPSGKPRPRGFPSASRSPNKTYNSSLRGSPPNESAERYQPVDNPLTQTSLLQFSYNMSDLTNDQSKQLDAITFDSDDPPSPMQFDPQNDPPQPSPREAVGSPIEGESNLVSKEGPNLQQQGLQSPNLESLESDELDNSDDQTGEQQHQLENIYEDPGNQPVEEPPLALLSPQQIASRRAPLQESLQPLNSPFESLPRPPTVPSSPGMPTSPQEKATSEVNNQSRQSEVDRLIKVFSPKPQRKALNTSSALSLLGLKLSPLQQQEFLAPGPITGYFRLLADTYAKGLKQYRLRPEMPVDPDLLKSLRPMFSGTEFESLFDKIRTVEMTRLLEKDFKALLDCDAELEKTCRAYPTAKSFGQAQEDEQAMIEYLEANSSVLEELKQLNSQIEEQQSQISKLDTEIARLNEILEAKQEQTRILRGQATPAQAMKDTIYTRLEGYKAQGLIGDFFWTTNGMSIIADTLQIDLDVITHKLEPSLTDGSLVGDFFLKFLPISSLQATLKFWSMVIKIDKSVGSLRNVGVRTHEKTESYLKIAYTIGATPINITMTVEKNEPKVTVSSTSAEYAFNSLDELCRWASNK